MSSLSFQPIQNGPLYQATETGTQKVLVYWLLLNGSPSGSIAAADTWKYGGCYIFIPADKPIANVSAFITAMQGKLGAQANTRWAAWITDPAGVPGTMTAVNGNLATGGTIAQTIQPLAPPLANIILNVPGGVNFLFDPTPAQSPDTPAIAFQSVTGGVPVNIGLQRVTGTGNFNATLPPLNLAVPLCGPSAGALLFDVTVDWGTLNSFFTDSQRNDPVPRATEVRYFYGTGAPNTVQTMHYPFYPPLKKGNNPVALNVSLDPLNVWDSTRTVFALDQSMGANLPQSTYFSGTDGHPLTLKPTPGAGFAFSVRPPAAGETAPLSFAYLTPAGVFSVEPVTNPSHGLAGADPTAFRHFMCGMAGTEYLIVEPGATVEFFPGNSAFAAGFTAPTQDLDEALANAAAAANQLIDPSNLIADTYTTSWIQINPPAVPTAGISYGYAVQPESSVYYSTVNKPQSSLDSTPYTYPLALGCRVSLLQADSQSPLVPLPLSCYGGVWATGATTLPPASALQSFESQIISTTRHSTAPKDTVNGPTFFDPVNHLGVDGGFAKTPEGLLAQLNTSASNIPGTFQTIFLAKSPNDNPVHGAEKLSFNGTTDSPSSPDWPAAPIVVPPADAVVNPILSNALMNNNLFMVATNYFEGTSNPPIPITDNPFGSFQNEIQMGEWTFRLDVGYSTDKTVPRTTLLFKFTTALNVMDLVANQAYWQEWENFIGSDSEGTAQEKANIIQKQLNAAFLMAKPDPSNPDEAIYFADFWAKINDPNWTGILAINCGLDAGDLPPDLQDLLGGINGELRAHHFGVTVNQINDDTSTWNIDQSSMFALVYYDAAYVPPPIPIPPPPFPKPVQSDYGFQVLKLNALFENSVLTHFDSRIAVTIPQLFGENVTLETTSVAGLNVLEIEGVYQKHGDTGTVVFDTKTPQIFKFVTPTTTGIRAIQEMYVTDAALVPVSSTTSGSTITVLSNLAMSGDLMFLADVDPAGSGLDIFSYGTDPKTGLGFNTYNIAMTTTITNDVGTLAAIGPDTSSFMITPATSTYRPSSLLAALPLKLTSFVQGPGTAGWPVSFLGAAPGDFEADYALSFQVSLGSLGALSSFADSLDVDMVLGWKVAGKDSADNLIWLLMVPPQSMQGQLGFGLEGVLDTTFGSVDLVSQQWTKPGVTPPFNAYGVFFMGVQIQLLGMNLIPTAENSDQPNSNFILFADPSQGNASNMGWLMTYVEPPPK
jgi:hypothetical protein